MSFFKLACLFFVWSSTTVRHFLVLGDCEGNETETLTGIIYADNWFKFYFNGELIATDPITVTPHQAVNVSFSAPVCGTRTFAISAYDNSDNITSLEHDDKCIGDGGLKAMFSDGTVTNSDWMCMTFMYGPLEPEECIPDYNETIHFNPTKCKYNFDNETGWNCTSTYYNYSTNWFATDFEPQYNGVQGWESATEFNDSYVGFGREPDCDIYLCPEYLDWAQFSDGEYTNSDSDVENASATFIWRPRLNFDNRILCTYSYSTEDDDDEEDNGSVQNRDWVYVLLLLLALAVIF